MKKFRRYFGGGIGILLAVVAIFVITHVIYYTVVYPPMKEDRRVHVATSIYSLFGYYSWNILNYYDIIGNRLFLSSQKIMQSDESSYSFCKDLAESDTNVVAVMIEYRPGTITGHPESFAPSYVGGKFINQVTLPLEKRIFPGRQIEDSVWHTGMRTFIEGPVYSPACGCNILLVSLTRFDRDGMFAIFSVAINFDKEIELLNQNNPYPQGNFYVLNERDGFVINMESDADTISSAYTWLCEKYGESARERIDSTMVDDSIHVSELESDGYYFYSSHDRDAEFYYFYAIPTKYLLTDVFAIARNVLIAAFCGAFLIIVICFFNIYFVRRMSARESAMEKEIETAAKIQQSMLVSPSDIGDGCMIDAWLIPAKYVGGDLYCYFRKTDKLFFCIGDVVGKGVSAAMHMSKCISLFRNISRYCSNSKDITSQLNVEMCADNGECFFISVFVGILDLCTGELDYCNAGHEKPLYWSGKAGETPYFVEVVSDNIVLGAAEDFEYKSGTFKMERDSVLMQYTDGVDESTNDNDQLFGKDRLLQSFASATGKPVSVINNCIVSDIKDFVGKHPQSDDITLLTVHFKG